MNKAAGESFNFHNPNFNFSQFNSNLVICWEYISGSSIYFVWSQGRIYYDETGDFNSGNNFSSLFSTKPENIFLIKLMSVRLYT
jgi:hypothetical protein